MGESPWILISERLPDLNAPVFCVAIVSSAFPSEAYRGLALHYDEERQQHYFTPLGRGGGYIPPRYIRAWMPIPPLPKEIPHA